AVLQQVGGVAVPQRVHARLLADAAGADGSLAGALHVADAEVAVRPAAGEGVEQGRIPWRVLKSAWRHEDAPPCPNCARPTLLTSFGYFVCGFYKRGPELVRICPPCRSSFEDHSPWDGPGWLLAKLDGPLLPSADLMFGRPMKYTLPWTAEGQAHQAKLRQQGIKA